MDTEGLFQSQRARLERLTGTPHPPQGVRQHFLRLRPGVTHRAMAAAGLAYDSSYGFADRNGFRLGVADVIPVWDEGTGGGGGGGGGAGRRRPAPARGVGAPSN